MHFGIVHSKLHSSQSHIEAFDIANTMEIAIRYCEILVFEVRMPEDFYFFLLGKDVQQTHYPAVIEKLLIEGIASFAKRIEI